jgi:3-phosphoshikimate 1-carboxyvinyltransferase
MKIKIERSLIRGKVDVPPSKSMTIRAIACASLAKGSTYLKYPLVGEDTHRMIDALTACGIRFKPVKNGYQIDGGTLREPKEEIFCGESAAVFRFMIAIATLIPGTTRIVPGPNLAKRPVAPLLSVLSELEIECSIEGSTVVIHGGECEGGEITIPGDMSSQFISAMMTVGPCFKRGLVIQFASPLKAKAYINMTDECMREFGVRTKIPQSYLNITINPQSYHEATYTPDGDWSFAANLLALGAITSVCQRISTSAGEQYGNILVTNLKAESKQADRTILNMIQKMGGRFSLRQSSVMVQASQLYGFNADFLDCITLFPIMAVMASTVQGSVTTMRGLSAERKKFNNDIDNLLTEFSKLKIRYIDEGNSIKIIGSTPVTATVDTHDSFRIGLALIILGSVSGNITIENAECVENTYPNIWKTLESIGVKVNTVE